jgi:syntaxin 1B/2/3
LTYNFKTIYNSYMGASANIILQNYYKNSLRNIYNEINNVVKEFTKDVNDRKDKNLKTLFGNKISKKQIDVIDINNINKIYKDALLSDNSINDVLLDIEHRNIDILELEKSVNALKELFKDMEILVNLQEKQIKIVSEEINETVDEIKEGQTELVEASNIQNKTRKCLCWLLITFLLVLAVVLGVFGSVKLKWINI